LRRIGDPSCNLWSWIYNSLRGLLEFKRHGKMPKVRTEVMSVPPPLPWNVQGVNESCVEANTSQIAGEARNARVIQPSRELRKLRLLSQWPKVLDPLLVPLACPLTLHNTSVS